uniref:Metalloendopeptidase n=1 Tax=Strongyloides venezuelensis TaxID=75913 RepID=A0A0K0FX47_STRVS
ETCATFVRTYNLEPYFPGIRYYYGKGCWSYLGKVEPYAYQGISLGRGCHYTGTAAHETLHALGLNHEQERVDRDQYIRVYFQNIKYGEESNFVKISALDTSTYNIKYDLGSLMQYDLYAFSDNGRKTMDTIERIYEKTPGQNERLSFADAKIVNLHYCTQKCINKISCYNGGYQNPKDCTKCKCPQGFHGKYCDEFPPQVSGCPSPCYNVKSEQQSIQFAGPVNCTVHLRTQVGRKIRMNINKSRFYEYNKDYFCYSFNTFEVKYFADKTVTGARFCGSDYNIPVASENHHIVLIFSSISRYSDAQVTFSSY